jgi:hypothetical protein
MRSGYLVFIIAAGAGLVSCTRDDGSAQAKENARQAGREAYRASQDVKRGAKQAAKDLRDAGKEFREGWTEAERKDKTERPRHTAPERRDEH